MTTLNEDVMELKIDEPISSSSSSSLLKPHHHYHESSGYSSKEAECSSPENKTYTQHRQHDTKLRITANNNNNNSNNYNNNNNNNNNNNSNRTGDIHRQRHRLPTTSTTIANSGSLSVEESLSEPNDTEATVRTLFKSFVHINLYSNLNQKANRM
ncbi:unnamed protein product [Rotaria magnacalcarata]|uniref:Uncharacterized protein n=1 Tax=Rotaria magnacalcarata TaxID=392030 RepID=A0A8S2PBD2_9BILA|nr:unnamed protein product [Rotaria magnacalcarata]CAF4047261.1 unnamed protein product [Rotaria magnacalcarata]CAF4049196.1 unnamed protein product [Rotaria magnacalcarata]